LRDAHDARKPYPSDVSDDEWALVVAYLTLLPESGGQRRYPLREVFNGLRYIVNTGAPWRWMPNDLPPWEIVSQQAQRWLCAGCFEALAEDLRMLLRLAAGKNAQPRAAIIDSRTLRSTPESGARSGYDGAKRKKGSKLHMAVDTLGHLLALHVTPANADDRAEIGRMAKAIRDATDQSVEIAYVDQGTRAKSPPRRLASTASNSRSSSCPRPSTALSYCRDAGSSSARLLGPPASEGSSETTSAAPRPSQTSISSPSSAS
jgi:transposase